MTDTAHPLTDHYYLPVDYSLTLPQMIAAGHYDWTNPGITATRFPITGTGTVAVEAKLYHFGRQLSSKDAVKAITTADADHPWMPALIEHLLAFGAAHPDEQRRYTIVALGSVAEVLGHRGVPCLGRDGAERGLYLGWWDYDWRGRYRFLAVRTRSSGA
jgi:hypothetical protein